MNELLYEVHMVAPKRNRVAVIGEFFIDEIFSEFSALPKLGEECFARRFRREVGGGAAITSCALAKLGVHVSVVGSIGKADGQWLVDRLRSFDIDCSGLELDVTEPTGITVSASTREDRSFLTHDGANQKLEGLLRRAETARILGSVSHVHFACAPDSEADGPLLSSLRRRRRRISIDVQSHISWLTRPESLNILRQCDVFFPNEREGGWISSAAEPHEILQKLKDKGLRGVGLKLRGKRRRFTLASTPVLSGPVSSKKHRYYRSWRLFQCWIHLRVVTGRYPPTPVGDREYLRSPFDARTRRRFRISHS